MYDQINRNIFGYWHQGRDNAPEGIKRCWDLWARMNPGWTLKIYEWEDIEGRLAELGVNGEEMSYAGLANMVRLDRLAEEGGVWVDAYTVPFRPLDEWLPDWVPTGFFAFHDWHRKKMACTWFLASRAGHPLAVNWRDVYADYWRTVRRPMRSRRELDPGSRGTLARLYGRFMDFFGSKLSPREVKRIYKLKDQNWAVAKDKGAKLPIYPYFAMAMTFNLMVDTDPLLRAEWSKYPKFTPYDYLLFRHWKKQYDRLTPDDIRAMCHGRTMQKLALPTPLPDHLMDAMVAISEAHMPGVGAAA